MRVPGGDPTRLATSCNVGASTVCSTMAQNRETKRKIHQDIAPSFAPKVQKTSKDDTGSSGSPVEEAGKTSKPAAEKNPPNFQQVNLAQLWKQLSRATTDEDRYRCLHGLERRLRTCIKSALITPEYIKILQALLVHPHSLKVKLAVCLMLRVLHGNQDLFKLLVRFEIVTPLVNLLEEIRLANRELNGGIRTALFREVITLISLFSQLDRETLNTLLNANALMHVAGHLHPLCSEFYGPSRFGTEQLRSLTSRQPCLVGEVSTMRTSDLREEYEQIFGREIPEELYIPKGGFSVTSLYDTLTEHDRDIIQELVSTRAVWSCTKEERGSLVSSRQLAGESSGGETSGDEQNGLVIPEKKWVDLCVSHVVSATTFWAHVGDDAQTVVAQIEEKISQWPVNKRTMLTYLPKIGTFVCAYQKDVAYFRGQIISHVDERTVHVFSLDYGFIIELPWAELFLTVPQMELKAFPMQATLCKLEGVIHPPKDLRLIEHILETMLSLTSDSVYVYHHFKRQMLRILIMLVGCPEESIVKYSLWVISNVARSRQLREKLGRQSLFPMLKTVIKKHRSTLTDESSKKIILAALCVSANLFAFCVENKDIFAADKEGLMLLLQLAGPNTSVSAIELGARKTLRALTGSLTNPQMQMCVTQMKNRSAAEGNNADRSRPTTRSAPTSSDDARNQNADVAQERQRSKSRENSSSGSGLRQRSLSRGRERSCSANRRQRVVASICLKKEESSDGDGDNDLNPSSCMGESRTSEISDTSNDTGSVNGVADLNLEDDSVYIFGRHTNHRCDEVTELIPARAIADVDRLGLSGIIVSFLNAGKKGTVYIGLEESGAVTGCSATRKERDECRQGVDQIMKAIHPGLMFNEYSLHFHQVYVEFGNEARRQPQQDKFVVELKVFRGHGHWYATPRNASLIRRGNENVCLDANEQHTEIIMREEKALQNEIEILQFEIERLQSPRNSPSEEEPQR